MHPLLSDIATFYRRWHALEETFGSDNGTIIDFDYCPAQYVSDSSPFQNRVEVLTQVERLISEMAAAPPTAFCNHQHLALKLQGSRAYVRALMGERIPIQEYIRATIGVDAKPISSSELDGLRDDANRALNRIGLSYRREDLEQYELKTLDDNVKAFGEELREIATQMVAFVRSELKLTAEPRYTIQEVQVDEYWTNFVDGKRGEPLRLRFNTHPRKTYRKGIAFEMAAHEVAAHLINILELSQGEEEGRVDAPALNTTLHSCELFQMEGLEQCLIRLLDHPFEISAHAAISEAVRAYHSGIMHNAHLELEGGRPVDEVIASVSNDAPYLNQMGVLSELRDRSRSPLYRTLIFAYYPSRRAFSRAAELPSSKRKEFLRSMYRELWTPTQIEAQLESLQS